MKDQIWNKGQVQKRNGSDINRVVRCCPTKSNEENENIVFQMQEVGSSRDRAGKKGGCCSLLLATTHHKV